MRTTSCLLAVCLLLGSLSLPAAEPDNLKAKAAADLKEFYANSAKQPFLILDESERPPAKAPPYEKPLKQLIGDNAEERRQAAAYLAVLVAQALEDEQSGAARWRSTPYWGESAVNSARQLRESIANALAEAKLTADALPVLRWYLDKEPTAKLLPPMMTALAKIDGKEADALRAELAARPHTNAVVAVEALKQITERKGTLPAERLAVLCQHHRAAIRAAARKLNEQQGGEAPAAFDPAKALRSPAVQKMLDDITPLIIDPPPADAKFVAVTTVSFDDKGKKLGQNVTRGWLLKEEKDRVEVLTPFGQRETFEKHEKPAAVKDGKGTYTCTVAVLEVKEEVDRITAIRAKEDKDFELSERGPLTGQFRGRGAGRYEIMLGHWLYQTKQDELAAHVVLPALDSVYEDRHLVLIARSEWGEQLGYQMLCAFVGERNYARTEKLAKLLAERFPETRFHGYAVRLAEQLPRRKDDFNQLKLPTSKDWADQKAKLKREEQIDYLSKRLRLLNCFQMGQPGGFSYFAQQYAEPCGLADNASWGRNQGKTEVINPVVELLGDRGEKAPKGLDLKVADIPLLAPYLKDDDYLLIVSFWRDFHPDRNLHGTRGLFAGLINRLALQDLCRAERYDAMTAAEREKDIERIIAWAKKNTDRSERELLLLALEDGVDAGERWYDIEDQARRLMELKEKQAVPLLVRYLDAKQTDDSAREALLVFCRELDVMAVKDASAKYLDHPHLGVRFQAARIAFEVGDRDKARQAFGDILAKQSEYGMRMTSWSRDSLDILLKDDSEESRKAARRLLSNPALKLTDAKVRARLLRRFCAEKLPDGYRFYRTILEVKGKELDGRKFERFVTEEFADEIANVFAATDPDVAAIKKQFSSAEKLIPALKQWLDERIADPKPIPEPKLPNRGKDDN